MGVFEHARSRVYNPAQHPLVHDISSFAYTNPRLPGVSLLGDTIDYIIAVLYPKFTQTYPNVAALPATASPNDYAIVSDDGAGHAAGYVWSVVDNSGQWVKRYDMAWSMEAVLAETVNRTQYLYAQKYGVDDKDPSGNPIAGLYAGQRIYGGATSGNNLTLSANSGNVDPSTHSGFVQIDDQLRPTVDNAFSSGSLAYRWANTYSSIFTAGTLTLQAAQITDTTGNISFGSDNLTTTGGLNGAGLAISGSGTISNISIGSGAITSSSGALSFGGNNVTTTGTLTAATGSTFGHLTLANGSITDSSGAISFSGNNLSTTGTLSAGATTVTSVSTAGSTLSGATWTGITNNADLNIQPLGTGKLAITSAVQVGGNLTLPTGNATITSGSLTVGALSFTGTTASTAGTLTVTAGTLKFGSSILPTADASFTLGSASFRFTSLYLSSGLSDGTTTYLISDALAMRNNKFRDTGRTQAAQTGDALFYDATSQTWLASAPDTEILHSSLSGLTTGDAGHTQFVQLTGRAGGQVVQGGTAASNSLTLESTSNATKGAVFTKDSFKPFTTASYSAGWSGTDLGDSTHSFRDFYSKGQFYGFRAENVTSGALPSSSAQNVGRLVFATDNNKIYVDNGTAFQVAGVGKYLSDISMDGTTTAYTVTTTGISDARNAIWQLCDNSNSYERIFCSIKAISATQVTVTANPALPTGSYRLIGLE